MCGSRVYGEDGREVFPVCAHGVAAAPSKSTGSIPTPVLALRNLRAGVLCWDGHNTAPTG